MCNTTYNNHSHEEYNIDYIGSEQILEISKEDVPCNASNITYIISDECDCNKNKPKKVNCRSLACQQLNDECSCKRNKKVRKTTMVNVLENNVLRLEDKMKDGCAEMHESIEDLEHNINKVYNELKDEEARAKLQEAFLHYGLDDAVTYVEYHADDRLMHFYHENPANCLNVDVHEGCDCDCCNACGCDCNCNYDECLSDIPYTMDENCNIIPMKRERVELFTLDCRDFIRDVPEETTVSNKDVTLRYGLKDTVATINGVDITVTMPADTDPSQFQTNVTNNDPTLGTTSTNIANIGGTNISAKIPNVVSDVTKNGNKLHITYVSGSSSDVELPSPGTGADGNDYVVSGQVNEQNKLILTRKEGGTVEVQLPAAGEGADGNNYVTGGSIANGYLTLNRNGGLSDILIRLPKYIINVEQIESDPGHIMFTWSDNSTTVVSVGGSCLWKRTSNNDGLEPVAANSKVYGYGFYDQNAS